MNKISDFGWFMIAAAIMCISAATHLSISDYQKEKTTLSTGLLMKKPDTWQDLDNILLEIYLDKIDISYCSQYDPYDDNIYELEASVLDGWAPQYVRKYLTHNWNNLTEDQFQNFLTNSKEALENKLSQINETLKKIQ